MILLGSDTQFNGRWNIRVKTPRNRVWWLEIRGAGEKAIRGSFVGAPLGQVDEIRDARIENGTLTFTFDRHSSSRDSNSPLVHQRYSATYKNGQLIGTREETIAGKPSPTLSWIGVPAPAIEDRDDGTWTAGTTTQLFNGRNTEGWRLLIGDQPGWFVEDGSLKNRQGAADIVSLKKFWNFEARLVYRYSAGSNSGVALRGRYEIQILDSYGQPPDVHSSGALYSRIAPASQACKPAGEWQTLVARLVGRELTVTLNGVRVIDHRDVVGPTAMTMDPDEAGPGPLVLQGDHGPVEFRDVQVTELVQRGQSIGSPKR